MKRLSWLLNAHETSNSTGIVVGGSSRSGTTLVRVMLDSHPEIACGPESGLFCGRMRERALRSNFDISLAEIQMMKWRVRSFPIFVTTFMETYASRQAMPMWAEKTPANVLNIDWVLDRFPNVIFCHVIRDGRAVVNSLRSHPRFKVVRGALVPTNHQRDLDDCIKIWTNMVSSGLRLRGHPRVIETRYEELVEDPKSALEPLLRRTGLAWDDSMLSFHEVRNRSRDVRRFPQTPEAAQPIFRAALDRWKHDLSEEHLTYIERAMGQLLNDLGYRTLTTARPQ